MKCISCGSEHVQKNGQRKGLQSYKCMDCRKVFTGEKYENNYDTIVHFNIKIKKTNRNNLTRELYCIPTNKISYQQEKNIKKANEFYEKNRRRPLLCPECYCKIPNEIFSDEHHYTESFVEKHYKDCMENFDLNMNYFSKISFDNFNKYLLKFVKKNKFIEINDLNILKEKRGIYILVLDEYKQVYIGKAENIKKRILQHWSSQKEFDHLLHGGVESSRLSIDSFGALDTTRIYYKEIKWYKNTDEIERDVVSNFDDNYLLNRIPGGINGETERSILMLKLNASPKKRDLNKE